MSETIQTYNKNASTYERRWKNYLRHTHTVLLEYLEWSESDTILDLSCGTGLLAHMILETQLPFQQLVLNDRSGEMLNIARSRLATDANIRFSNASAHDLPFDDNSFNRVVSLNAFHNYTYQDRVVSEIRRVLIPGGRFYLLDWNRSGFFRMVNALIKWWVPEHIDTRSLDEIQQLLKDGGFTINRSESWNYRYWKLYCIETLLNDGS